MIDHRFEWRGELARYLVFPTDFDLLEERLIERSPHSVGGAKVSGVAVLREVEGGMEVQLEIVELRVRAAEAFLYRRDACRQSLLLCAVKVSRDVAVQVSVEQLLLARSQPRMLKSEFMLDRQCLVGAVRQIPAQRCFDVASKFWRERYGLIEPQHTLLYYVDRDGRLLAICAPLVASAADEVLVDNAVSILGVLDDQATAAFGAHDRALEVVMVGALLLTDEVEGEHVLYPLPRHGVDDRFVSTRVGDALKRDDALVVRIRQHLLQLRWRDRLGRSRGRRARDEAAERQFFS